MDDSYSADENKSLTIAAPGVLANDSDADGQALSVIIAAGPNHGILNLSTDGSFVYTPTTDYDGPDEFIYTASDGDLS